MENNVEKLIVTVHRVKKKLYELEFAYNLDLITKIKEVCSDRKWKPETKRWELNILMLNELILAHRGKLNEIFFKFNSERDKLEFIKDKDNELRKKIEKETRLSESLDKQSKIKDLLVEWREDVEKNGFDHLKYFKEGSYKPFNYQVVGAKFIEYNKNTLLSMDMGTGKAQPNSCLVLTPNGYVKISDLKIKDEIINSLGKVSNVLGVFPQGEKEIYKIIFTDNTETLCCGDHLWKVTTRNMRSRKKGFYILSTNDIIRNGVLVNEKNNTKRYFIDVIKPVEFSKKDLPIHPYVLGCLLGDGGLSAINTISYTSADQELIENLNDLIDREYYFKKDKTNKYGYLLTLKEGKNNYYNKHKYNLIIKELGLSGKKSKDKFIPEIYKYSSIEDRVELLRGLMDTDGTLDYRSGESISYTSVSNKLIDDIIFLVQSLGGITKKGKMKIDKKNFYSFSITISLPPEIIPFKLKRKLDYFKPKTKYKPYRGISSIEKIGVDECTCISVNSEDNLYVTNDFILTHNTTTSILGCLMKKELKKTLCIVPNSLKYNWRNEIQTLTNEKWYIIGSKDNLYTIEESKFIIVNYDYFRSSGFDIAKKVKSIGLNTIDSIIFDESHKIKNTKTNTYKNIKNSFKKQIKTYILLSGTPIESKITELYTQLNLILPDEFSNKNKFYEEYCAMKYVLGTGWVQSENPDLEKIYNKLMGIMYRVKKSDVQKDLPPVMRSKIFIEMTDEEKKEYESIESGLAKVSWERIGQVNESDELSDSPLAILTRLRQFTSALKIKYCVDSELIEEINGQGEKLVVFDVYKDGLKKLYDRYKHNSGLYIGETKPEERQKLVDVFQDPDSMLKNLYMSIATGNVGITLTTGNNMILLTIPWLPSEIEQCIARLDRIGQKNVVKVFIPIIKGSIDEDVYYLVLNKTKVISKAIDNIDYVDKTGNSVLNELLNKYKNKYKK